MRRATIEGWVLAAALGLWPAAGSGQAAQGEAEAAPTAGADQKPKAPQAADAESPPRKKAEGETDKKPKARKPARAAKPKSPPEGGAQGTAAQTTGTPAKPPKKQPRAAAAPEASAGASGGAKAQAASEDEAGPLDHLTVQRAELDNGLRVVMSPDHTIPTVAIAVYYDVGSRNEVRGRSGFAHLFEHMMFQGSYNVAKGEHFELILNRGGTMNGTTSSDRTNYFETLPSNELELGLWLEADRMQSLAVNQENFENQRQTVMEERRQSYDNRPYAKSWLRINELAYGDYWPYAHSTIGDMEDLQNAPLSAVQEFFDQYYAPNNAVLTLVGDFDPDQALALVQKYFGDIEPGNPPEYAPGELPPQTAERRETMVDPLAQLPAFHLAWHIPPSNTPDHYPLELLGIVLGDGESSRLYQKLVKKRELLQQLHVATDDRRGPDLFSVWAVAAEGKDPKKAQQIIFDEIESVAKKGVTQRELQKAKNRVRSMFVFGLSSNLSRAMMLSTFELYFDDARLLKEELDHYLAVTADDIQRVAARYFAPTNRTVLDVTTATDDKGADK